MGFERIALFGTVELHMQATATGTLTLKTDLPGEALAVRETHPTPVCSERVVRIRLSGTTKGRLYAVKFSSAGQTRIYGGRIRARALPDGAWQWFPLALPETAAEWTPVPLDIPKPSEWAPVELAIPKPSEWAPVPLDIPKPSEWAPVALAIPKPSEWAPVELAIPKPSDWAAVKLAIQPTPPLAEWVKVPMDE